MILVNSKVTIPFDDAGFEKALDDTRNLLKDIPARLDTDKFCNTLNIKVMLGIKGFDIQKVSLTFINNLFNKTNNTKGVISLSSDFSISSMSAESTAVMEKISETLPEEFRNETTIGDIVFNFGLPNSMASQWISTIKSLIKTGSPAISF